MNNYVLTTAGPLLSHGIFGSRNLVAPQLHDFAADLTKADIDAMIASGDYFGMLATSLDSLSQDLKAAGNDTEHVILDKIITSLLYIESKYTVTKR